jgi:hypothetical protein
MGKEVHIALSYAELMAMWMEVEDGRGRHRNLPDNLQNSGLSCCRNTPQREKDVMLDYSPRA